MDIIKHLSTFLYPELSIELGNIMVNFREHLETNPGLLGEKQERFLCAMLSSPPPHPTPTPPGTQTLPWDKPGWLPWPFLRHHRPCCRGTASNFPPPGTRTRRFPDFEAAASLRGQPSRWGTRRRGSRTSNCSSGRLESQSRSQELGRWWSPGNKSLLTFFMPLTRATFAQ